MELTEHEERFAELLSKDNTGTSDLERKAMFYILATPELYNKINGIYDFENHWIKTDCFKKVDLSSGFSAMVKLAFNLYNSYESPTPIDIFSILDSDNFDICINAIKIRFKKPFESI